MQDFPDSKLRSEIAGRIRSTKTARGFKSSTMAINHMEKVNGQPLSLPTYCAAEMGHSVSRRSLMLIAKGYGVRYEYLEKGELPMDPPENYKYPMVEGVVMVTPAGGRPYHG